MDLQAEENQKLREAEAAKERENQRMKMMAQSHKERMTAADIERGKELRRKLRNLTVDPDELMNVVKKCPDGKLKQSREAILKARLVEGHRYSFGRFEIEEIE